VEHPTGEKELYDLINDPHEEESLHANPNYIDIMTELSQKLKNLKGLMITSVNIPEGRVGRKYNFSMSAWGGKPPYYWKIQKGSLPKGLMLNSSGIITGIPEEACNKNLTLRVSDSSITAHSKTHQFFEEKFRFVINTKNDNK